MPSLVPRHKNGNVAALSIVVGALVIFIGILLIVRPNSKTPSQLTVTWPTSPSNAVPQQLVSYIHRTYKMPVLNIVYIPITKNNAVDLTVTGDLPTGNSVAALQTHIEDTIIESITLLTKASKYHGYKDKSAVPSLTYTTVGKKLYKEALPPGLMLNPNGPSYRPDYITILNQENICDYVDNRGVKEVWLWGYHTSKIEPAESNMSMGKNILEYWNFRDFGDLSNSEMTNDLPICNNTYVLFNLNYGRGTAELIENHTHHIERVLAYVDDMWSTDFVGFCGKDTSYRCGWTHYPPNVMQYCSEHDYDWTNTQTVRSDCENWNPDGTGEQTIVSCDTWKCENDTGKLFKIWWMQNIPGYQNNISYSQGHVKNWWDFIGDFDRAISNRKLTY